MGKKLVADSVVVGAASRCAKGSKGKSPPVAEEAVPPKKSRVSTGSMLPEVAMSKKSFPSFFSAGDCALSKKLGSN